MQTKTYNILDDCIERGIQIALAEHSPCLENSEQLSVKIEREIWILLDKFFNWDDEFNDK